MRFGLREVVFLLVLLVVPVASYIYVFKPRNEEIRQAQKEVEIKRAKLDKLREVAEKIDDIGMAIAQGREAIDVIEAKLPSQQDVEVILQDVWQLAKRARLVVKSVKSEKPVPAAMYMEQPLTVIMEGEFEGFYQFLLELENLPRITRIHEMNLERYSAGGRRGAAETPRGQMKADFTLSIYFEPRSDTSDDLLGRVP
ncbi:MAG: type IV pilus inner membrane component PilO [Planctomycetota bacterium]|jgi:Tfp pilus assembly protein PilO